MEPMTSDSDKNSEQCASQELISRLSHLSVKAAARLHGACMERVCVRLNEHIFHPFLCDIAAIAEAATIWGRGKHPDASLRHTYQLPPNINFASISLGLHTSDFVGGDPPDASRSLHLAPVECQMPSTKSLSNPRLVSSTMIPPASYQDMHKFIEEMSRCIIHVHLLTGVLLQLI